MQSILFLFLLLRPAAVTREILRSHHIAIYQKSLYEACSEDFGKDCGEMFQKEIKSLDKNISLECSSGSIIVHQTIFNCIKNNYQRLEADKRANKGLLIELQN